MYRFLRGKIVCEKDKSGLFEMKAEFIPTKPLEFSIEAKKVFEAGRKLWAYYHAQVFNDPQKPYNANASLYDIKAFFKALIKRAR